MCCGGCRATWGIHARCSRLFALGLQEDFFLAFAKFEEIVKEYDRARAIYKYALDQLPRGAAQHLYETFNKFEKQHGSRWVKSHCAAAVGACMWSCR